MTGTSPEHLQSLFNSKDSQVDISDDEPADPPTIAGVLQELEDSNPGVENWEK